MASVTVIMGEPGSGKTRLAGTWPNPYWINLETDGNTTAIRGKVTPNSVDIKRDANVIASVVTVLDSIRRLTPDDNGEVDYRGIKVGAVVVDSVDAMQETDKYLAVIPGSKFKAMDERGWGKLADDMWPFSVAANGLPVPLVIIAHSREREIQGSPVMDVTFNLQGSFKTTMNRIASEILVTLISNDNKRYVLSQPFRTGTRKYTAKDRHGRLSDMSTNGMICIDGDDGYPPNDIAEAITGRKLS